MKHWSTPLVVALSNAKALVLVTLVFQNCTAVLLTRHVRRPPPPNPDGTTPPLFSVAAVVLVTEVVKAIISILWIMVGDPVPGAVKEEETFEERVTSLITSPHRLWQCLWYAIFNTFRTSAALFMLPPAVLFTLQNNLIYHALENVEATVFQVLYQLKLLLTAVFVSIAFSRPLNSYQWISLFLLFVGVVLSQLKPENVKPAKEVSNENFVLGVGALIVASVSSAVASVVMEKVLKSVNTTYSIAQRNLQLALYSLTLCFFLYHKSFFLRFLNMVEQIPIEQQSKPEFSFLHGFTPGVWGIVAVQALGGFIVSLVLKYADNILKGFATAMAIVVCGIFSYFVFAVHFTYFFLCGASIVIISTLLYSWASTKSF